MAALVRVGDTVLTTRDLQINQFLNENDNPFDNYRERAQPLKELIWEQLIFLEAQKIFSDRVSQADVDKALKSESKKLSSDRLWRSLRVHNSELRQAVQRKLSSQKLLQLKMPVSLVYVSEKEVETYYEKHSNEFGGRPLKDVKERILNGLRKRKVHTRFTDWVGAMERTNKVRYFAGVKVQ